MGHFEINVCSITIVLLFMILIQDGYVCSEKTELSNYYT